MLRGVDTLARLGGDEFAVLLPDVYGVGDTTNVADTLLAALSLPFYVEGVALDVEASIGVVISGEHRRDTVTLMQHADIAMYVAKGQHLGEFVHDPSMDKALCDQACDGWEPEYSSAHYPEHLGGPRAASTASQTRRCPELAHAYDVFVGVQPEQNAPVIIPGCQGEVMELNRRDLLKGAVAVTTAGSLTVFLGAGPASATAYPALRMGSRGPAVLALQRRLTVLGYWLGRADGNFGDLTRQAVVALQKVGGLQRDGQCGPLTWTRVNAGLRPKARTAKTSKGHVIEINKANQTLLIVHAGVVKGIYSTSTGSNQRYYQGKLWHTATTPSGSFRVFRQVNKWDDGPLGKLYRPKYFNRGIAVHGYPSVPTIAASHGCARVSLPAMDSLWAAGGMPLGTTVLVY